ncbi:MAG: nucleoside hydrolase [Chloroflexi bacterium]|nr:MAG: nucleoside hydrolase [Chloroflexota bacterium]
MTTKTKLIVDTDTGIDDAQALMMALAHPQAEIAAITMVSGNVHLDLVTGNVARVLDVCGADVPFYRGMAGPLIGEHVDAADIHEDDGLGNSGYPPSSRQPEEEHAVQAILRLCNAAPQTYTLVALGPLTNIALAVRLDPQLPQKIKRLIVMGGTVDARGNITLAAEYNFYADPEAAHIVLSSFPKTTLISWEATIEHAADWDWYHQWAATDTPRGRFNRAISRNYVEMAKTRFRAKGYFLPDPLAMAVALEPSLVLEAEERWATIELRGEHTRGQIVVNYPDYTGRHEHYRNNVEIIRRVDMDGFLTLLEQAVAG